MGVGALGEKGPKVSASVPHYLSLRYGGVGNQTQRVTGSIPAGLAGHLTPPAPQQVLTATAPVVPFISP